MKLKDFEIVRNKERPDMCFKYILRKDGLKFEIFTMNYGKIYNATIEEHAPLPQSPHRYLSLFKSKIDFICGPKEAVRQFKKYLKDNQRNF